MSGNRLGLFSYGRQLSCHAVILQKMNIKVRVCWDISIRFNYSDATSKLQVIKETLVTKHL